MEVRGKWPRPNRTAARRSAIQNPVADGRPSGVLKTKLARGDQETDGKQAKLDLFGSLQKNEASNTGKIAPGPGQNELAGKAADASASKPCL